MPLDLEEDWAVIRPNRNPPEAASPSPAEPTGYVWVAFCYQGDALTCPRIRVPIPAEKELVARPQGACALDVFRVVCPAPGRGIDWIPETDVYVDRMLLYFTQKGGPSVAEASGSHMPVLNLGMVDSIDLGFIVDGLGKLMVLHRRQGFALWEAASWYAHEEHLAGISTSRYAIPDRIESPTGRNSTSPELQAFGRSLRAGMGMTVEEALEEEGGHYYPPGLSR